MAIIKQYWWVGLVVAAFIFGILINGSKPDKEVELKYVQLREIHRQTIEQKDAEIKRLRDAGKEIRDRAIQDSVRFMNLLKAKEINIRKLKDNANAVNYKNYRDRDLDSIRAELLRAR